LGGLGFVYFKGSENVNLFIEADLRWTCSLEVQTCLAEKNLDWVENGGIRGTAII
jgi:hypothetical protein